jgi:hypothetical protein
MCVIAAKYFKGVGWVGAKNRDRNYLPTVNIVQSNRTGTQRLYLDDEKTRYTEGLNEYGVSILSASLSIKSDEKEGDKAVKNRRASNYMSPDGKDIRDALLSKTIKGALDLLIERELSGCTLVFDQKECYLLEGGFTIRKKDVDEDNPRDYIYKVEKVKDYVVRSNHGILLPQLGYKKDTDDEHFKHARKSSEERLRIAREEVDKTTDALELMNALSTTPNDDSFMNPIRTGDTKKEEMVTTGQILLIPKEKTMHYRPIFSEVNFKYSKLNGPDSKTFFEIVSSKKLLGFREFVDEQN